MYNTIDKNYRINCAFGNSTSHQKYSKNVVEIQVNTPGFSIIFIPHYNTQAIPFPPFNVDLEYFG